MANKMLIDATHPEETRVVVLRGNRVEEFDFESASRKQLRGNIYLAKVTRVEPSLQAAFVDYGGNRHGFLAFSEIHPDYYQIPVADRQALIDEESREHRAADAEEDRRRHRNRQHAVRRPRDVVRGDTLESEELAREAAEIPAGDVAPDFQPETQDVAPASPDEHPAQVDQEFGGGSQSSLPDVSGDIGPGETPASEQTSSPIADAENISPRDAAPDFTASDDIANLTGARPETEDGIDHEDGGDEANGEEEIVESVGGEADVMEEVPERAPRNRRQYKIQEVIKRRQVMLVQVVKEERGTKGAALTTYLSLAGRYSVLMPNTARGGGISRKVTNPEDRRRMKEVAEELEVPDGMGVILRTAGANRTKTEVKRDFEYLLRLWETVRDLTLKSTAPKLVYEEGSLVKRSIRDLYHKDIDEVVVEGDNAYQEAKDFMRMLMPSHAKNVKPYKDTQPVFTRYGIENQLDAMFQPTVQLKSGGYIVLNQAEALVAIDVNSGRATREHSIEETALKTNLEAAAEIARQLRLRDLAGLIVIDFIDMDEKRNNRAVERKLKESLKSDRARIQVGRISHFGLLEMSRQRIRTSVLESSTETCPHCGGSGHVRSVSSVALQLLRAFEEMLLKGATHNLIARTRSDVALYVLNHKRAHLRVLEERFRIVISVNADSTITGQPPFTIDRGEQVMTLEQAKALVVQPDTVMPHVDEDVEDEEFVAAAQPQIITRESDDERGEGRRRRRGRRGRGEREHDGDGRIPPPTHETVAEHDIAHGEDFEPVPMGEDFEHQDTTEPAHPAESRQGEARGEGERKRRRRGRRGGRRNRRDREDASEASSPQHTHESVDDDMAAAHVIETPPPAADFPPPDFVPRSKPEPIEPAIVPAPVPPTDREQPKRRSTVREPAPFVEGSGEVTPSSAPPPAPLPPAPEPRHDETPDTDRPRRAGWWSRRS